jgi:hypothetical protein
MRRHAARMAATIAHDVPNFPGHDIEHSDALWATADVLVDAPWRLNPLEAFVFGAAVLVHDLAMTTAAYGGGRAEVEATTEYGDAFAPLLARSLDGDVTGDDLDKATDAAKRDALVAALRAHHAQRAADLPTAQFQGPNGPLYLIEDSELRHTLGWVIGQIAASHGQDLAFTDLKLRYVRPTPIDMQGMSVDALVLACLLRCADAIQLDGRRAREFQQLVQAPTDSAVDHWTFLALLHPAGPERDRLSFESVKPFPPAEAAAWWLAYDWLTMADHEIRDADALLADRRPERRFARRSIAAVDTPQRLAERVRTDGWLPVDARLHATDVVRLARILGGRQLYGDVPLVPLRELVQNAMDAVRARGALEGTDHRGAVEVSIEPGADGLEIRVKDDGIGMTSRVLTGPLLDFGTSLWHSDNISDYLPGLASTGFESTGRFGIGFFAAFIWSERINVVSRSINAKPDETLVLEFAGLAHRPLVRTAKPDEQLTSPGTVVTIATDVETLTELEPELPYSAGDVLRLSLDALVAWLAPTSPVEIRVRDGEGTRTVVASDDWLKLPAVALVERVAGRAVREGFHERLRQTLRPIVFGGLVVGRAALWSRQGVEYACLTVGGLRSEALSGVAGVVIGEEPTVARNAARPIANGIAVRAWLAEQVSLLTGFEIPAQEQMSYAECAARLGVGTGSLVLCISSEGPLNDGQLREWARRQHGWVIFVRPGELDDVIADMRYAIDPGPNVLVLEAPIGAGWLDRFRDDNGTSLEGRCRLILAEEWGGGYDMWDDVDEGDDWADVDALTVGEALGTEIRTQMYGAIQRPLSGRERAKPLVHESEGFRSER